MDNHILYDRSSLRPEVQHFLKRPHIENLLKDALKKPLTTVIAGAGYGKTQAVATMVESAEAIEANVVWLQLSQLDNLIARLWERFVYEIKPYSKDLAQSMASLGYPDSAASFQQFLRLIAKALMHKKRFVIVLDDFHSIYDNTILDFFEKLIIAQINNLSIILISRTKPDLSLARMLSQGLLVRITEDDLRFSKEEMKAYYQKQGLNLDALMLSNIYSYTEGWILAIYLVGLSLKKGNVHNQNPLSLVKVDIFELIEEEIFNAASKELQKLLVTIALLDAAPIGLLKELAGGDFSVISEMTKISLLIRYDSFSGNYRLHNLFKDFLLERKNNLSDAEVIKTHLIAAKWYENNNHKIEAISHYKQCNYYNEIFDIILSIDSRVSKKLADSFTKLIEEVPAELIQVRPIMLVVKAKYLFDNNKINEAYEELTQIREKYEALPPSEENYAILGEAYIMLALISIVSQNFEFIELFKMADKCLPNGSSLVDYKLNIADGINVTGIKNPVPGELKKYQDALFDAAPYAARVMNGCGYGMEYLNAADSAYMIGDIKNAEKNAYETVYRAQLQRQYGIEYMANFILVRIFVSKGDYTKTVILLKRMKEQVDKLQNSDYFSLYDIIEGWFYVKIGETAKVSKWIMHEEETRKILAPVILGREYLVRSDCLLAEGRDYELLAFMEHSDVMYESRGVLYAVIQNKITKSIIYHYMGDSEKAMHELHAAYELSHPNKLIIQYIEYGNKMRTVTQAAMKYKDCKIPKAWLENIYTKSSTYTKRLAQVCAKYNSINSPKDKKQINLTKRELEVLTCLCHGLTRDEIAVNCGLSVNTVKSMLQIIYNKLGALNSLDAVRIATMMNLV